MGMVPTVFVVDDESGIRSALTRLFKVAQVDVESFESAEAFLAAFRPERSGCLVLDVNMPGMSGLELQQELRERRALLPIVFLTASADVTMAVAGMKGGAVDFIEKPFDNDALLARVREALDLDRQTRDDHLLYEETLGRVNALTPREREVLDLIVAGRANKMIAYLLGTSVRTIEVHRAHVMEKMQASSVAELVRLILLVRAGGK
jgi:two-component system response regulator FixJ